MIGVAFDGTSYGTDGTVWGGEFLFADYGGFTRLGSLSRSLAGGDRAVEEGWRAVAPIAIDPARGMEEALPWATERGDRRPVPHGGKMHQLRDDDRWALFAVVALGFAAPRPP